MFPPTYYSEAEAELLFQRYTSSHGESNARKTTLWVLLLLSLCLIGALGIATWMDVFSENLE